MFASERPRRAAARARPPLAVAALVGLAALVAGCSASDDRGEPTTSAATPSTTTSTTSVPTSPPDESAAPGVDDPSATTGPAATGAPTTDPGTTASSSTTTEPTVPETGVPGLDSEVAVCRAWSRFAGSFQVAAVVSSFGPGTDPLEVPRLEVMASPVIAAAVDEMLANWPDQLADERDAFADRYVGPYARRSARALDALEAAGADSDAVDRIAAAWLDALAARDPSELVPIVDLDAADAALVDAAAASFDAEVPPIPEDPSLVSDVDVPDTEAYLTRTCPDRGTLAGGEVTG